MEAPEQIENNWKKIGLAAVIAVVAAGFLLLPGEKPEQEEKESNVINGGVIGGPVQIGKSRIKVTSGTKDGMAVREVTVSINDSALHPRKVKVIQNGDVRWRNDMDTRVQVNFIGYRKLASLAPGRIYRIKFNEPGLYNYTVSGQDFNVMGAVRVY